jgi:hypothetical protein
MQHSASLIRKTLPTKTTKQTFPARHVTMSGKPYRTFPLVMMEIGNNICFRRVTLLHVSYSCDPMDLRRTLRGYGGALASFL